MSLTQCKEVVMELFNEKPIMACRIKEALDELLDEGFHDETVWDLYKSFLPAWLEHISPRKMTQEEREERQRHMDEAAGM